MRLASLSVHSSKKTMSGFTDLSMETSPPKEANLFTFRDRMAQPPFCLERRLRVPVHLQGLTCGGIQPAQHHPLCIHWFHRLAGRQALSLRPSPLLLPSLDQLESAQGQLSLRGVSPSDSPPGQTRHKRADHCTRLAPSPLWTTPRPALPTAQLLNLLLCPPSPLPQGELSSKAVL